MSASPPVQYAPVPASASATAGRWRGRWRRTGQRAAVATVFLFSLVPIALTVLNRDSAFAAWWSTWSRPVEELRPLAALPADWQGRWYDTDKNYTRFERWFADNHAARNLMIRTKNELDYRLFRSSTRVYYGKDDELYGRSLADIELTATENEMSTPERRERALQGLRKYAQDLQARGVTMLLIAPVAKQYFTRERLPFFAPRLPDDSNFMKFYAGLRTMPELHLIDVDAIQRAHRGQFPLYYRQDFHWTDLTAMTVAAATVERIAKLEGMPLRWRHRMEPVYEQFEGVEARFAARLTMAPVIEPHLKQTWTERHSRTTHDPRATGLEFETDTLDDPALLPPTCMYGNSFSDGMLRAGLPEHFTRFTKFSRALFLPDLPKLTTGRCKYLVVQVLDIQAGHWLLR
jgi:alginate O-acetyltransferase complex protein AlgJ